MVLIKGRKRKKKMCNVKHYENVRKKKVLRKN
jgi:hypothetical protein